MKLDEYKNGTSPVLSGSEVDNDSVKSVTSEASDCQDLLDNLSSTEEITQRLEKRLMIRQALDHSPVDVEKLRQLSIDNGGLLDHDLRTEAWSFLLEIDVNNIPDKPSGEELKSHKDYKQVVLDVNRSVKRFPPGMEEEERLSYQDQLIECIMWILLSNIDLYYYQGFHDVVVTFLLVVGEKLTFALVDKLCKTHFRDFMEQTMEKTNEMLYYLLPIIDKTNPDLSNFLQESEVGTIFCLSWLITWYGHVLNNFKDIVRLYDFFIACHSHMPIYLAAHIVVHRVEEVMACECEMPYVHKLLSRMPEHLPFEKLIIRSADLFLQYPPSDLEPAAKLQRIKELRKIRDRQEMNRLRIPRRRGSGMRGGRRWQGKNLVWVVIMGTCCGALAFNYWRAGGVVRCEWLANRLWM